MTKSIQGVLTLTIKDPKELHASYMSFIEGGGLFIPSTKVYKLGDEVMIRFTLMDEMNPAPILGQVVWVTPLSCQSGYPLGVGVRILSDDARQLRDKIELHLVDISKTNRITHTL